MMLTSTSSQQLTFEYKKVEIMIPWSEATAQSEYQEKQVAITDQRVAASPFPSPESPFDRLSGAL